MTLAERVNAWLEATGKKQNAIAKKAGIGKGKVSDISTGANLDPRWSTVQKLVAGFDLSLDEFFTGPRPRGTNSASAIDGQGSPARIEDRLGDLIAHIKTLKGPARGDFIRAVVALLTALERADSAASSGGTPDDAR